MMSNCAARSNTFAIWMHSATLGSTVASSDQPFSHVLTNVAEVTESPVAKSVTSWPAATNPSVSKEQNSSHGP